LHGVEQHRARIGALLLAYDLGARALAPHFELLDGRGAKGVGGAHYHATAFALEQGRKFADGGCLADAIHAHHHDDGGRRGGPADRLLGPLQHLE
jgi:hypothetical protein